MRSLETEKKPLVGISACLLGETVRYDGGGKLDRYLRDVLGKHVDYVPVCPEVESGMGVPREAMRLVNNDKNIRLVTTRTQVDLTDKMSGWIDNKIPVLRELTLCGYILKARSPSCGLMRVKVYKPSGGATNNGMGMFARGLTESLPLLPLEEEGRLNDSKLRENFIERIFAMHRWHVLISGRKSIKQLMDFHARHKYTLMAHCPKTLGRLGMYLANSKQFPINDMYQEYFENFITALGRLATVRKNTNTLQHIMGYFKKDLSADEKAELAGLIHNYQQGHVPLIVPITLLNHYVRKFKSPYLAQQYYLNPHPLELMLRNHV